MRSYAKVVFVDINDIKKLPKIVQRSLTGSSPAWPLLTFMSPNNEKHLGTFSHPTLKTQDYRKIFRDLKKKIKSAKEAGELTDAGLSQENDDSKETEEAVSGGVLIVNPIDRIWKSAKGSELKAKLVKFEGETYTFQTSTGKKITVKASDLDPSSVELANDIISNNR